MVTRYSDKDMMLFFSKLLSLKKYVKDEYDENNSDFYFEVDRRLDEIINEEQLPL